ncbi:MAG TPA: glycosyltransferase family 87 protein [Puia sp.]
MKRWLLILISGLLVLLWSIPRDIRYTRAYPVDLRNRIVGARLEKDGRLPYFYKWSPGDGVRYYDPRNFDNWTASNITASPFFHHLLSPIADWPQATLLVGWLVSEYGILALMTVLCFFWAKTTMQKQMVLGVSILFLLTSAWKLHVSVAQIYLWIPALALLFFGCIRRPGHFVWGFCAGVLAASLLLIRFNTLFFFAPMVFLARRYSRLWWMAFFLPLLAGAGWVLGSPQERALWKDYDQLLQESVRVHQGRDAATASNAPDPHYAQWEGIDVAAAKKQADSTERLYLETGNAFILARYFTARRLPPYVWPAAAIVLIGALLLCFWRRHRPFAQVPVSQVAIFAFCLYMLVDLFSPIYRIQYYSVQWLFPLLVVAMSADARQWKLIAVLAGYLLLTIVHLPWGAKQNTLEEYVLLAVLLGFSEFSTGGKGSKTGPASLPKSR